MCVLVSLRKLSCGFPLKHLFLLSVRFIITQILGAVQLKVSDRITEKDRANTTSQSSQTVLTSVWLVAFVDFPVGSFSDVCAV